MVYLLVYMFRLLEEPSSRKLAFKYTRNALKIGKTPLKNIRARVVFINYPNSFCNGYWVPLEHHHVNLNFSF